MKRKIIFTTVFVVISLLALFVSGNDLYICYVKLFKKTEIISHGNSLGNVDGEVLEYVDGSLFRKGNGVNGLRQGVQFQYFKTGIIKRKLFFRNDKKNGKEYTYYDSGNLQTLISFTDGRPYGSGYYYSDSGKLLTYALFDIQGNKTSLINYDNNEEIASMDGFVISNVFFSSTPDSTIVINNSALNQGIYSGISDLNITVASPPNLKQEITVTINNVVKNGVFISEDTFRVPNAFPANGKYEVFVEFNLLDKSHKAVNGLNIKTILVKK